jgi:hypothetical protein
VKCPRSFALLCSAPTPNSVIRRGVGSMARLPQKGLGAPLATFHTLRAPTKISPTRNPGLVEKQARNVAGDLRAIP